MMAAATAACMCFCFVQAGRALFGYIAKGAYRPGCITLSL
jgi:hypothetical protein